MVISATVHEALIQTMSNGKRMSFIQKVCFRSSEKMNSRPVPSSRTGRPDNPWKRFSGVSATSTVKDTPPMVTVGSGGITLDTGVAVGALVGVAVAVGGWLWGTSPPQDVITTGTRPIAVQINRICKAR